MLCVFRRGRRLVRQVGFRLTIMEKVPFELSLEGQAWLCREGAIWGKGI